MPSSQTSRKTGNSGILSRFKRDQKGGVALITALAMPVFMLAAGGIIDYGRGMEAKSELQSIVDAAGLATGKHVQEAGGEDVNVEEYFRHELEAQLASRDLGITITNVSVKRHDGELEVSVDAKIPTTFLRFIGIEYLPIHIRIGIGFGPAPGGDESSSVTDVALVMDTNGHRAQIRRAARQIVEALAEAAREGRGQFRIAVVPYGQYVNVGLNNRDAEWLTVPPDGERSGTVQICRSDYICLHGNEEGTRLCRNDDGWQKDDWDRYYQLQKERCQSLPNVEARRKCTRNLHFALRKKCYPVGCKANPDYNTCDKVADTRTLKVKWEGCVGSRTHPGHAIAGDMWDDPIPGVMNYQRDPRYDEMDVRAYSTDTNYCPATPILPLTDVDTDDMRLDDYVMNVKGHNRMNYTYTASGLAWGWRMLSPNAPFNDDPDAENHRRVVILLVGKGSYVSPSIREDRAYKEHITGIPGDEREVPAEVLSEVCSNMTEKDDTGKPLVDLITIDYGIDRPRERKVLSQCSTLGLFTPSGNENVGEKVVNLLAAKNVVHLTH